MTKFDGQGKGKRAWETGSDVDDVDDNMLYIPVESDDDDIIARPVSSFSDDEDDDQYDDDDETESDDDDEDDDVDDGGCSKRGDGERLQSCDNNDG